MKIIDVFKILNYAEAIAVLEYILEISSSEILLNFNQVIPIKNAKQVEDAIKSLQIGMPLCHITGFKGFWNSNFMVKPQVFVPRADSETLISSILNHCKNYDYPYRILDLGTGTGCLILSLLQEFPYATGLAVDINSDALSLAFNNALALNLQHRVIFKKSNWLNNIDITNNLFDIVVSNPPYIKTMDIRYLSYAVKGFDPLSSLDGGIDGLNAYREIFFASYGVLKEGGILALEHGYNQKVDIIDLASRLHCFKQFYEYNDLGNNNRVLLFLK